MSGKFKELVDKFVGKGQEAPRATGIRRDLDNPVSRKIYDDCVRHTGMPPVWAIRKEQEKDE